MGIFIIALIVVVCILLGLIILVQNPKGGGLASGFTGATQIGGVQKTNDFLEKSTWYLTIALFVLCLVSANYYNTGTGTAANSGDGTEQVDGDLEDSETGVEEGGADAEGEE